MTPISPEKSASSAHTRLLQNRVRMEESLPPELPPVCQLLLFCDAAFQPAGPTADILAALSSKDVDLLLELCLHLHTISPTLISLFACPPDGRLSIAPCRSAISRLVTKGLLTATPAKENPFSVRKLFSLTSKATRLLAEKYDATASTWKTALRGGATGLHDYSTGMALLLLLQSMYTACPSGRISYHLEHRLLPAKDFQKYADVAPNKIRIDALVSTTTPAGPYHVFLETDLGTERIQRLCKKIEAYLCSGLFIANAQRSSYHYSDAVLLLAMMPDSATHKKPVCPRQDDLEAFSSVCIRLMLLSASAVRRAFYDPSEAAFRIRQVGYTPETYLPLAETILEYLSDEELNCLLQLAVSTDPLYEDNHWAATGLLTESSPAPSKAVQTETLLYLQQILQHRLTQTWCQAHAARYQSRIFDLLAAKYGEQAQTWNSPESVRSFYALPVSPIKSLLTGASVLFSGLLSAGEETSCHIPTPDWYRKMLLLAENTCFYYLSGEPAAKKTFEVVESYSYLPPAERERTQIRFRNCTSFFVAADADTTADTGKLLATVAVEDLSDLGAWMRCWHLAQADQSPVVSGPHYILLRCRDIEDALRFCRHTGAFSCSIGENEELDPDHCLFFFTLRDAPDTAAPFFVVSDPITAELRIRQLTDDQNPLSD